MGEIYDEITSFRNSKEKKKHLDAIRRVKLPAELSQLIEEYEKSGGKRSRMLWKWSWYVRNSGIILSSVAKKYFRPVSKARLALTIFITILDDVADNWKNEDLLREITKIPLQIECLNHKEFNSREKTYLDFTVSLWEYIVNKISDFPRFEEFKRMFLYDLRQSYDSLYYSYLINENPELLSLDRMITRESSNMISFVYTDIELMASPNFDRKDLGYLRKIVNHSQKMIKIGNWLGTWKRELKEEDISSGLIAYAVENNIVSKEELKNLNNTNEIIKKIENSNAEKFLIKRWKEEYDKIKTMKEKIKSIETTAYLEGHKNLFKYQFLCNF